MLSNMCVEESFFWQVIALKVRMMKNRKGNKLNSFVRLK